MKLIRLYPLLLPSIGVIVVAHSTKLDAKNNENFLRDLSESLRQLKNLAESQQRDGQEAKEENRHLQFYSCPTTCTAPELCDCLSGDVDTCNSSDSINNVLTSCGDGTLSECLPSEFDFVCSTLCSSGLGSMFGGAVGGMGGSSPFAIPGLNIDMETVCGACDFLDCCGGPDSSAENCASLVPDLGSIIGGGMVEDENTTYTVDSAVDGGDDIWGDDDFWTSVIGDEMADENTTNNVNAGGAGGDDFWGDDDFWTSNTAGDFDGDFYFPTTIEEILPMIFALIGNASIPEFCPDDTCPVDGLCECLSGDIDLCDINMIHEVCATGSFFSCGPEGLEEMCAECAGSGTDDFLNMALCGICNIATCCNGENTIEQCVMSALPEEIQSFISAHQFCPDNTTCPVEGFCDCLSGNFMECDIGLLNASCAGNVFFECGPTGFESMCDTECSGDSSGDDFVSFAHCAVCDVAKCCRDGGTIEDCATASLDMFEISDDAYSIMSAHQFCPNVTACPVDGFCDCLSGDFMECDSNLLEQSCDEDAFFLCGPVGFEDMCENDCGSGVVGDDFVDLAHCAVCSVAKCCRDGGSIDECMTASLPPIISQDGFDSQLVNYLMPNLEEFVENLTVPEFCPNGTCAVDGFCGCFGGNLAECNINLLQEACAGNAFFNCGPEGFEDVCATECSSNGANSPLCVVCGVAECCSGNNTLTECVQLAVPTVAVVEDNSTIAAPEEDPIPVSESFSGDSSSETPNEEVSAVPEEDTTYVSESFSGDSSSETPDQEVSAVFGAESELRSADSVSDAFCLLSISSKSIVVAMLLSSFALF